MSAIFWALSASIAVSVISFVGVVTLLVKENILHKMLILLIGFSAGALMGGAFFHLLPEAAESGSINVYHYLIAGFLLFLMLERYLLWHHCHDSKCTVHPFGYLNLIGDGVHNFIDGLVIGSSFVVDVRFGLVTTMVIIFHEIPQEIGDFGVLVYSGFGKMRALFYNFLSAVAAIIGAFVGVYSSQAMGKFSPMMLAFTAGGFLYIACCDLIPEIHKQAEMNRSVMSMGFFMLGLIFMFIMSLISH